MPTFNGNEYANRVAVPAVMNKAYADGGRVRIKYFSFTTPAGMATNDLINMFYLPAGAILLAGFVQWTALGGSTTMDIGNAGTPTKYLSAQATNALGTASFLNTAALNYALVLAADELVIMRGSGAGWTSAQTVNAHVFYVKD